MPRVTLVYDADCPNVEPARAAIREALRRVGSPADWDEELQAPDGDRLPSPTILVDGRPVGDPAGPGPGCRVYAGPDGLTGAPPVETVVAALGSSSFPRRDRRPC